VRYEKKLNEVLMVATLVAETANETMVAPMVVSGGVCVLRESGVCSQAVGFLLVRLAGIWLQSPRRCFHI
jgi:hypothetical protein